MTVYLHGPFQTKFSLAAQAAPPAANYVGYVVSGKYIYIAGQIPMVNGELKYVGKVGCIRARYIVGNLMCECMGWLQCSKEANA